MEEKSDMLKRVYKYHHCAKNIKKCKKCIDDLYDLSTLDIESINKDNPKHMTELGDQFDKMTEFMGNDKLIKIFNKLSNIFFITPNPTQFIYKLKGRELLSVFLFGGFPEFTLDLYRDTIDAIIIESVQHKLHKTSVKIIKLLRDISSNNKIDFTSMKKCRSLLEYVNLFTFYYIVHMNNDRKYKLQQMLQHWYNNEKEKEMTQDNDSIDNNTKNTIVKMLQDRQIKTFNNIQRFNKDIDKEFLSDYKRNMDSIEDTINKAFWDTVSVTFEPGTSTNLVKILLEINDSLKPLVPVTKRSNVYTIIDDKIDIEFIKRLIDSGHYNPDRFLDMAATIIGIVISIDSRANAPIVEKQWRNMMLKESNSDEDKYKDILKFILDKINKIKEDLMALKMLDDMGFNVMAL